MDEWLADGTAPRAEMSDQHVWGALSMSLRIKLYALEIVFLEQERREASRQAVVQRLSDMVNHIVWLKPGSRYIDLEALAKSLSN
jgi:hypothetical protein